MHPGSNHTPGDAVAHLPEESVVICGDLVSTGYHVNYEDASPANLERGLETLRALGARSVVPGHGPPGGPELLDRQSRYHSAIRDAVLSALRPEEALARIRSLFPGYLLEEVLPSALKANW